MWRMRKARAARTAGADLIAPVEAAAATGGVAVAAVDAAEEEVVVDVAARADVTGKGRPPKSRLWRPATKVMFAKSAAGDFLPIKAVLSLNPPSRIHR